MTEQKNVFRTNSIVNRKYAMLFKGDPILKEVRGIPLLFEECPIKGLNQELVIFHLNASMPMVTQAFCAIDISRETPSLVSGISLFDPKSGEFKSETVFPGASDDGDIISCYRIMNLLESLPVIDIGGNMTYVSVIPHTWAMLSNSVKKEVAEDFGMSLSGIKKILKEYPPDLDNLLQVLKHHHINVPTNILQQAVFDGKIELTPELAQKGILSVEETARINKRRKHFLKPYFKYLSAYFYKYYDGASLTYDSMYCILAEKFINDAIRIGVRDRDLILTYSLFEIDNLMVENAMPITMSLMPEIRNDCGDLLLRGIGEFRKIEGRQRIIEFVRECFSNTGRTSEYYELFLLNLKDQVTISEQD